MNNPKEIVKTYFDRWNKGDVDGATALLASDFVRSGPLASPQNFEKEFVRKGMAPLTKAFPDLKMEITEIVAHGDTVALEEVETGTFTGPLEAATLTISPTNRSYKLRAACFFQVNADGLITEMRNYWDTKSYFQQLGIDPESFSNVMMKRDEVLL